MKCNEMQSGKQTLLKETLSWCMGVKMEVLNPGFSPCHMEWVFPPLPR